MTARPWFPQRFRDRGSRPPYSAAAAAAAFFGAAFFFAGFGALAALALIFWRSM